MQPVLACLAYVAEDVVDETRISHVVHVVQAHLDACLKPCLDTNPLCGVVGGVFDAQVFTTFRNACAVRIADLVGVVVAEWAYNNGPSIGGRNLAILVRPSSTLNLNYLF
jgi:hypothetical protein